MNTRAAGRGTTTAGIAATTDAVTTVAAAGERGRQGTTRGVIYQPGSTLTKFGTFPENRTTSVSRSLTGSSTVPVHRKGGSRQRMSGPSTMSHPAMWTCPACGRPLTVALNPEGGEAGAHRPLEISRASAAAHACAPAARFPQFHNASSLSIIGYEPASCQPWQPPVSAGAGAEDDEGVISQSEYTLTKPSSCPNHRDHVRRPYKRAYGEPDEKAQSNFTDPESGIMKTSNEGFQQCYNAQVAVDAEHQLVVATDVTANASDQGGLPALLDEVEERFDVQPDTVLADAGYCNERDLAELETRGVDGYVATGREDKQVAARDLEKHPATGRMVEKLSTPTGRAVYADRKWLSEAPYGWIKHVLGFRRFSLRGLAKVRGEWDLVCLALNAKRLHPLMAS